MVPSEYKLSTQLLGENHSIQGLQDWNVILLYTAMANSLEILKTQLSDYYKSFCFYSHILIHMASFVCFVNLAIAYANTVVLLKEISAIIIHFLICKLQFLNL